MNVRAKRPALLFGAVAAVLALGACGGGDRGEVARLRAENEALRKQAGGEDAEAAKGEATPAAASGSPEAKPAKDGDWSWADGDTSPAAAVSDPETPKPRPVQAEPRRTEPQRPPAPKPAAPAPEPVTNRLGRPPAPPAEPEPAAVPVPTPSVVPAGAALTARLETALDSGSSSLGSAVEATLARDVLDTGGRVALPAGTRLLGKVTDVRAAKRFKRKSRIAFHFDTAQLPDGTRVAISAGRLLEGEGYTKKDGAVIGGSAAGGAVLGQVLGGDSEATAAGAALGGAIASGVVFRKRGDDIVVPSGAELELDLETTAQVR